MKTEKKIEIYYHICRAVVTTSTDDIDEVITSMIILADVTTSTQSVTSARQILTLLYQCEVRGLQVKMKDGTWLDVPLVSYDFVMNTGRCLERWTNGCLKAINHRVKLLREERLSVPFFWRYAVLQ